MIIPVTAGGSAPQAKSMVARSPWLLQNVPRAVIRRFDLESLGESWSLHPMNIDVGNVLAFTLSIL